MKIVKSSFFRALCAIAIGAMLAMYREEMVQWLAIIVGGLFFISGLVSVISYFVEKTTLPFVGAGSMILGIALMVMPSTFITWMMYGLAAMLIIGAIGQFVSLVDAKKYATFSVLYWVMPTITLLVGIFIIVKPIESAALPFRIIGWAMMFYGVVETIQAIKIYRVKKEMETQGVQEVQEVQEVQGEQGVQGEKEVQEEKEENAESTDNPLYILTDDTNSL